MSWGTLQRVRGEAQGLPALPLKSWTSQGFSALILRACVPGSAGKRYWTSVPSSWVCAAEGVSQLGPGARGRSLLVLFIILILSRCTGNTLTEPPLVADQTLYWPARRRWLNRAAQVRATADARWSTQSKRKAAGMCFSPPCCLTRRVQVCCLALLTRLLAPQLG